MFLQIQRSSNEVAFDDVTKVAFSFGIIQNMALPVYDKPHATPDQVVAQLRDRGLDIPDPTLAANTVAAMGYARLRMYLEAAAMLMLMGGRSGKG